MKVAVSFLSSDYEMDKTIELIDNSIADYIHVDVMDGLFVNNKNFSPLDLLVLLGKTNKLLDVHLMVNNPIPYINAIKDLKNLDAITIHSEIDSYYECAKLIKDLGIKLGIALNPSTVVRDMQDKIELADLVLVMSVVPGAGGQKFIEDVIYKIAMIKAMNKLVYIDGGINDETIKLVKSVDCVISGSYVCKSLDYNERINKLK